MSKPTQYISQHKNLILIVINYTFFFFNLPMNGQKRITTPFNN